MQAILLIILKAFLLGFFLAYFEPLQDILQKIKSKVKDNWATEYIKTAVSCHKCLAFWIGMILSVDIYIASAAGLMVYLFDLVCVKLRK